jgi:hypothetical protein
VTDGVRHLELIGIATFLLRICPADDKTAVLHVDRVLGLINCHMNRSIQLKLEEYMK